MFLILLLALRKQKLTVLKVFRSGDLYIFWIPSDQRHLPALMLIHRGIVCKLLDLCHLKGLFDFGKQKSLGCLHQSKVLSFLIAGFAIIA